MSRTRLNPDARRDQILSTALEVAESCGFSNLSHKAVAEKIGCSRATIHGYFKDLDKSVMRAAVAREILPIIAQGIVTGDKIACSAREDLKHKALLMYTSSNEV